MAKTQKEIEVIAIALNRSWTILSNLNLNQILFDSLFNFHLDTLYFDMMYVTTEAAVYAIAGQRYVTTAGIALLKKSAFARGLVLVPVVVGVLDVLVILEHIEQLFHVLDVLVALELDIGLRDEADVRADEGIVLLLERLDHVVERVGVGRDLENIVLGVEVIGAGIERIHHDGVLVIVAVLVVDDDNALAVERPAHAALRAHALAVLIEIVTDLRRGALAVVGQRLNDHGHTAGAVALVSNSLVVVGVARAERLVDGALDVVVGHIGCLRLGDDGRETGVVIRIARAALLDGDDDLLGDLGEGGAALGVSRALRLLDIVPLGMSGHDVISPYR